MKKLHRKLPAITRERLFELVDYKPESGELVWKRTHRRVRTGEPVGSMSPTGHIVVKLDRQCYLVHRLVWFIETGKWPSIIDHANRDPSDNRFVNLREATPAQNQANAGARRNNSLGVKGVLKVPGLRTNPFIAKIRRGGRQVTLGYFPTVQEASDAYHRAARENWGDFAAR